MTTYNVHRRAIGAAAEDVGALVDQLATPEDPLWPQAQWPAMRFDRPGLTPGGVGGHGPIGYRVLHHEPGRSVTFEFLGRPKGLLGHHQFVVQSTGPDSCVLWHLTDAELRAPTRWLWRAFWAPLHDALIEDALTRAQGAFETAAPVRPWSSYVRILRSVAKTAGMRRPPAGVRGSARPGPVQPSAAPDGGVGSTHDGLRVVR